VFVTVNCKMCKSAIALYCQYLSAIKVSKVLMYPIIQTRTRLISRVYHPTRDNMNLLRIVHMKIPFRLQICQKIRKIPGQTLM
jgi:hypothetical protein